MDGGALCHILHGWYGQTQEMDGGAFVSNLTWMVWTNARNGWGALRHILHGWYGQTLEMDGERCVTFYMGGVGMHLRANKKF